jgi:hypothetical protein
MSYLWAISDMMRASESGGVITVYWVCMKHDGEHTCAIDGSIQFAPDPASPDFVPYEALTEQAVLGWVWNAVSKVEIEQQIKDGLAEMRDPPILSGLPWQMKAEIEA